MSIALAPVFVLSAVQSTLIFRREVSDQQDALVGSVERSAASLSARIVSAGVLLRSLAPVSVGPDCADRLADIKDRIPGYVNLMRFDAEGRVTCAAATAPDDPIRNQRAWFRELESGRALTVTNAPGPHYAATPVLLASVAIGKGSGGVAGVLSGAITLESLRPEKDDRFVPAGSEVALIDRAGRLLTSSLPAAFPKDVGAHVPARGHARATVWFGEDQRGAARVFTASPPVEGDIAILLSAPYRDVVAWAWVNPLSAIGLPLLAFLVALMAVWVVADQGLVRWIAYLQRIAAIYAHGRYSVHPDRAKSAPPEIRDLAESLDGMARVIAVRDRALRETLAQKDDLLREIHHRVKNNLQVISSLLNLQQRSLVDPSARAAISDTQQRIAALALIYRALYEGPDLRKVDLRAFLGELIVQLTLGDHGVRPSVRTDIVVDDLAVDPDQLAPLALFAVEAITSARNQGLARSGGRLAVLFHVHGDKAELTITAAGQEGGGAARGGEGVGGTLMKAFARQLGGTVEYRLETDGGFTTFLSFPAPPAVRPN